MFFKKSEPSKFIQLNPNEISPNPDQPRQLFHEDELASLANSISEVGLLQPITVRHNGEGWELIAGERRLRASLLLSLEQIPCVVVESDRENSSILALVENIQRSNLDYFEEAAALAQLIENFALSQDQVAKKIGKSQSAVANKLRLLRLSPNVMDKLREGRCTERHARALLRLKEEDKQLEVVQRVIDGGLNVSQTEKLVELLCQPTQEKGKRIFILKDIRLFLNTINQNIEMVRSAGVDAKVERQDGENEILLTIRIPNNVPRGTI